MVDGLEVLAVTVAPESGWLPVAGAEAVGRSLQGVGDIAAPAAGLFLDCTTLALAIGIVGFFVIP